MGNYICCFCNTIINGGVTTLMAVTNWQDENEDNQQSQQLFCHLKCFEKAVYKPNFLYIDED